MWTSVISLASILLIATSCSFGRDYPTQDQHLRNKYRGVHAFVLRLDASNSKEGVMIISDRGVNIDSPGHLDLRRVQHLALSGNFEMPRTIHVTWRTGSVTYRGNGVWTGDAIAGDFTVPVAERIPDDVLDYIRKNGGALRLKIRLKDDGVLIGWDVEEWYTTPYGRGLRYVLHGGDFREAEIFNGKVIDPGWQK